MLIGTGVVVVTASLSVLLVWLAGRGVIPRNRFAGIRLPDLFGSDDAWREGHQAAVGPASVGAVVAALVWVMATLAPAASPMAPVLALVAVAGGLGWAAVAAVRAARATVVRAAPALVGNEEHSRPLASPRITFSGGLMPAAIVSWAPAVILPVWRLSRQSLPETIPSHWGFFGEADSWVPSIPAFWVCFAVGALSAVVVTAFVVFVGDDIGRFSGSLGLGALIGVTGSFSLTWITAVSAQEDPSTSVWMLTPLASLIGALVFVLATIRRRSM